MFKSLERIPTTPETLHYSSTCSAACCAVRRATPAETSTGRSAERHLPYRNLARNLTQRGHGSDTSEEVRHLAVRDTEVLGRISIDGTKTVQLQKSWNELQGSLGGYADLCINRRLRRRTVGGTRGVPLLGRNHLPSDSCIKKFPM